MLQQKNKAGGRSRKLRAMYLSKMFTETILTAPAQDNAGSEPGGSVAADRQESADISGFPLLCASILAGIFMLKNLLEVPASTAEASTPVEVAAEAVQRIEKGIGNTMGTRIQGLVGGCTQHT